MFTNQGSTHGIHVMDPGFVVPRCVATDAVTLQAVYRSQEACGVFLALAAMKKGHPIVHRDGGPLIINPYI